MADYLIEVQSNKSTEFNFIFSETGATNTVSKYPLSGCAIGDIGSFKIYYLPNDSDLYGL
jgi:hypothetical protein